MVELHSGHAEFIAAKALFDSTWQAAINQDGKKHPIGAIRTIFAIESPQLFARYDAYKASLGVPANEAHVFHGTVIKCNIMASKSLCSTQGCGACGISQTGFRIDLAGSKISFKRFGDGAYFAPHASKWYVVLCMLSSPTILTNPLVFCSHDYTIGAPGTDVRAILLCSVAKGREHLTSQDMPHLKAAPPGCHSVMGTAGGTLNFPELVVYRGDAALPRYIIVYNKDGIGKLA